MMMIENKHKQIPPILFGIVSDLDGVLTDTETLFINAINHLLVEEKMAELTFQESKLVVGLDNDSIWKKLNELRGLNLSRDEYTRRVDFLARDLFESNLKPIPGAVRFLEQVKERSIPLGLATSADRDRADIRLNLLCVKDLFDVIITRDDVSNAKPSPEIYILAAKKLQLNPENCLAIEDSLVGLSAAKNAGLFTVAVRTKWTEDEEFNDADLVVDKISDIELSQFQSDPQKKSSTLVFGGSK
jgi:HAD superfamily hydrolase (TIGR01509 family)